MSRYTAGICSPPVFQLISIADSCFYRMNMRGMVEIVLFIYRQTHTSQTKKKDPHADQFETTDSHMEAGEF